jgi:hypothetical protein
MQFVVLLCLFIIFMAERDASIVSFWELCFMIYTFGWCLDQLASILEHGLHVYTQNLWAFLDVMFTVIYWAYLVLRLQGWITGEMKPRQQALDVLAMAGPVLVPRIAFNLMSANLLFVSLRSMMADFALLTALAAWCFCGFLLSLTWLNETNVHIFDIGKWMIYIWFGLDGTGIHRSGEFHWFLGPTLWITFSFLGNTLFLTILVSMLTNTFSTIVANATAEIQYRHAVLTLEGVKSDAIFMYQPPFNILAMLVLVPLKFIISARWFHKVNVTTIRVLNFPLLCAIALFERQLQWPGTEQHDASKAPATTKGAGKWFWQRLKITSHGQIKAVFEHAPPDEMEDDIAVDDDLTRHLIRKQYTRRESTAQLKLPSPAIQPQSGSESGRASPTKQGSATASQSVTFHLPASPAIPSKDGTKSPKPLKDSRRRDSMAIPEGSNLAAVLGEDGEVGDFGVRLEAVEEGIQRIESMLARLLGEDVTDDGATASVIESEVEEEAEDGRAELTGTMSDLDRTKDSQ